MTYHDFLALPPMRKWFPLKYENGAVWTELTPHCARCQRRYDGEQFRGHVKAHTTTPYRGGLTTSYEVDALVFCQPCNLLSPITCLLHDNMTAEGPSPTTGEWMSYNRVKPTWWERFKSRIARCRRG